MPDCKNPHNIFFLSDPTMDSWLCAFVLTTLIFFCLYYCLFFLFVAIMMQHTELKTNSLRRFPYAKATYLFFLLSL
jgi:hypothetical protein